MTSHPLQVAIAAALEDAARRSGLPVGQLQVIEATAVTWPDGSLGCPQDGMGYTQALVPGYRIQVRAGESVLDYHAGASGKPFHCPPKRATPPLPGAAT
jgi:hypothetical protein